MTDQKAAALAEGRTYISAEAKIRLEEGEEAYQAELKRQTEAKAAEEKRLSDPAEAKKDAVIRAELNALRKKHSMKEI